MRLPYCFRSCYDKWSPEKKRKEKFSLDNSKTFLRIRIRKWKNPKGTFWGIVTVNSRQIRQNIRGKEVTAFLDLVGMYWLSKLCTFSLPNSKCTTKHVWNNFSKMLWGNSSKSKSVVCTRKTQTSYSIFPVSSNTFQLIFCVPRRSNGRQLGLACVYMYIHTCATHAVAELCL